MIVTLALIASLSNPSQIIFTNATIIDGTGKPAFVGAVKVQGDKIVAVTEMYDAAPEEKVIDANGLVLAPGFIDSHSHADGGIKAEPAASSPVFQGITTAVVGQDGFLPASYQDSMSAILQVKPSINFAAFTGHNAIRGKILGQDYKRPATEAEIAKMKTLVETDMKAGALGLSTGLEYNPGFYSKTEEVIELAKIASKYQGSYISHMRSEDREMMQAVDELIRIAQEAKLPAQVSHIKLGLPSVWGKTDEVIGKFTRANQSGLNISADIYPYTYWQSTITVITNSRDWDKVETWRDAIADTGGADKILLTSYSDPEHAKDWSGKTIAQIADETGRKPEEIVYEIVKKTQLNGNKGGASVIVTAMDENDIQKFMKWGGTSICSDGGIGGSHPRGAGTFPRVIHHFSQELKTMPLEESVRRMTSLPAKHFGFKNRGVIGIGMKADIVVFDPRTIRDLATPEKPTTLSTGVKYLMVNGQLVIAKGKQTSARPGQILTRTGTKFYPSAAKKTAVLDHVQDLCGG